MKTSALVLFIFSVVTSDFATAMSCPNEAQTSALQSTDFINRLGASSAVCAGKSQMYTEFRSSVAGSSFVGQYQSELSQYLTANGQNVDAYNSALLQKSMSNRFSCEEVDSILNSLSQAGSAAAVSGIASQYATVPSEVSTCVSSSPPNVVNSRPSVVSNETEADDEAQAPATRTPPPSPASSASSAPPPAQSGPCSVQTEQDKARSTYVPNFETEPPPCAQAAPVVEKAERAPVDILIVTDQESGEHAEQIEEAFKNTPPFKCMDLKFLIVKKSVSELDCKPTSPKNILKCTGRAARVVRKIKESNQARSEIVSVTYNIDRGGNWTNFVSDEKKIKQAFTSTAQIGRGAVHESLHTIGFEDEYPEGRAPVPRGTIMNSHRHGDIPQAWWPAIANFYGVDVPASCP